MKFKHRLITAGALAFLFSSGSALAATGYESCPVVDADTVAFTNWGAALEEFDLDAANAGQPIGGGAFGYQIPANWNYHNQVTAQLTHGQFNSARPIRVVTPQTSPNPFDLDSPAVFDAYKSTLPFLDYHTNANPSNVEFAFTTPLDGNSGILLMDIDVRENLKLRFYDADDTLLSLAGWDMPTLIHEEAGESHKRPDITNHGSEFEFQGKPNNAYEPVYFVVPPAGVEAKYFEIESTTAQGGRWSVTFVQGGCEVEIPDRVASVPTLGSSMLMLLGGLLGAAAFWRRRREG